MTDYFSMLSGPEAAQEPRPEPISSSKRAAGLTSTAKGSFVDDPMARARLFAKERNLPLSRYRVAEGRPVYRSDDDQEYYEEPNFAPVSDPGSILTSLFGLSGPSVAAAPPLTAGIITTPLALAGPGGLATSIGLTTAAGAGGQLLKESIGDVITGENQPGTVPRVIESALTSGLSQGTGIGINALADRFVPRDIARMDTRANTTLQGKATREGIPLTPAEITDLDSMKSTQRMLTNMPASSGIMRDFYEGRATNIAGRIQGMLDSIGQQDSAELAAKNLKDWATLSLEKAKNVRSAAASPFYERAKASGVQVDPSPILGFIDREVDTAEGAARTALEKARSYFFDRKTGAMKTSIGRLHGAKLAIDDLLGGLEPDISVVGPGGTKSTSFRAINKTKDALTRMLRDASPDYRQGLDTFKALSDPLNRMQNSLIGVLARTEDANSQKALLNMFNPATSGPRAITQARAVFERGGPQAREAWQDAKRIFLQDAWAKAAKEFKTSAQTPNVSAGAGWRALLLGDQRQTELLRSALSKDEFDNLSNLGDVLQATNRVRLSGSETTWNGEIVNDAKAGARPLWMRIIRNINPVQFLRSFDETVTKYFFDNKMEKMAKIYTSPNAMKLMKELRAPKPNKQRFVVGMAQLAGELGEDFIDDMLFSTSSDTVAEPGQAPAGPSYFDQLGSPPTPTLPSGVPMTGGPPTDLPMIAGQ